MISSAACKAMRVAKAAAFYAVVFGVLAALVLVAAGTKAEAAFSGKNGKIAFTSWRDGNPEVYTMNADGTKPRNLTNNTVFDGAPVYSPNGRHIAFVSERAGLFEIYRMGADGGSPLRLTYVSDNLSPSWQPLP